MIQVGIIGGAGYTAGELIRLLMFHKEAEINFVYSTSNAGNQISKVHQDLEGSLNLIKRCKPTIIIESFQLNKLEQSDVFKELIKLGYEIKISRLYLYFI